LLFIVKRFRVFVRRFTGGILNLSPCTAPDVVGGCHVVDHQTFVVVRLHWSMTCWNEIG
jgi:hypothetical protein